MLQARRPRSPSSARTPTRGLAQQMWEADQRFNGKATRIAAHTSTQMSAEFRAVEYDTSTEMDELNRIQMQEFAIKAEEAIDAQKHIVSVVVALVFIELHQDR